MINKHCKRIFNPKEKVFNGAMKLWIDVNISQNVILTDVLIKINAIKFSKDLKRNNFKASNGWLQKFKQRHGLKSINF